MAILDIFKKKNKPKIEKPSAAVPAAPLKAKRTSPTAYRILKSPHVTEKAAVLAEWNQYVFEVTPESNKIEVKKAIEDLYGIDVEQIRIVNIPRKIRIFRGKKGWKHGYKKAIVKIKKGQKIEVLPR